MTAPPFSNLCYELATGKTDDGNPCALGDLQLLTGAKVDLSSAGAGGPGDGTLCDPMHTYAALSAVPTDSSTCMWSPYVEGGNRLASAGLILRDVAKAHHYRVRVISNDLPKFVFEQGKID